MCLFFVKFILNKHTPKTPDISHQIKKQWNLSKS